MDDTKPVNKDRVPEKSPNSITPDLHMPMDRSNLLPWKSEQLPSYLEFTNNIYPSDRLTEKPTSEKAAQDKQSNEWTVAVQLSQSNVSKKGDTSKLDKIRDLAKETKDKPVTMLVQRVTPTDDGSTPNIEHYKLTGGEVTRLPDTKSKGFDKDVQDLVTTASHDNPAKKLALVVQSHGNAGEGMHGENGSTTIEKLTDAIKTGLNGSGHDKLDLIDLDACVMSESTVMDKMRSVTKDVVASEEMESAIKNSDGQNLSASLKHVTDNPSISANELADKIVADAKAGVNGEGTHTLSHLNLEHYDSFRKDLDAFGEQLKNCTADNNRKTVDKLIADTQKMAAGFTDSSTGFEWRDLKGFAQGVQDAIKSGQLKDADGKLLEASTKLLANFSGDQKVVQSSYGHDNTTMKDMDKLGGMSVFLPQHAFLSDDPSNLVSSTMLGRINDKQMSDLDRKNYQSVLSKIVEGISEQAPQAPKEFGQLKAAVDAIKGAGSDAEFQKAKQDLEVLAKRLSYSKLNDADIREVLDFKVPKRTELLKQEVDAVQDGGWKQFLSYLSTSA